MIGTLLFIGVMKKMFISEKKFKAYVNYVIKKTIKEFIMKTKIYSIKDTVTGNFSSITTAPLDGVIIRDLSNILKNGEKTNELVLNANDKALYCLGEYDVDTGLITSDVKFVMNLSELKEVK